MMRLGPGPPLANQDPAVGPPLADHLAWLGGRGSACPCPSTLARCARILGEAPGPPAQDPESRHPRHVRGAATERPPEARCLCKHTSPGATCALDTARVAARPPPWAASSATEASRRRRPLQCPVHRGRPQLGSVGLGLFPEPLYVVKQQLCGVLVSSVRTFTGLQSLEYLASPRERRGHRPSVLPSGGAQRTSA